MAEPTSIKKVPQWWELLPRLKQIEYLKSHPKSRLRKHIKPKSTGTKKGDSSKVASPERKAAIEVLSKNKEARLHVRAGIHAISQHPDSVLDKKTKSKLSEKNIRSKLGEKKADKLDKELKQLSKKTPKNRKRFMEIAMKVAVGVGLATVGGALLATGTLPFAILTGHLLKEAKGAYDEFADMVDKGQGTLKSLSVAMSKGLTKSMSNPATLAAATVLLHRDKKTPISSDINTTNKKDKSDNTEKKSVKVQKSAKTDTNKTKQSK